MIRCRRLMPLRRATVLAWSRPDAAPSGSGSSNYSRTSRLAAHRPLRPKSSRYGGRGSARTWRASQQIDIANKAEQATELNLNESLSRAPGSNQLVPQEVQCYGTRGKTVTMRPKDLRGRPSGLRTNVDLSSVIVRMLFILSRLSPW